MKGSALAYEHAVGGRGEFYVKNGEWRFVPVLKDHPDWVQTSIDGKPNKFVGGGGLVFWVDPGEESAWLCPSSPYVDYFNARVALLAKTAIDGLWGDVPLLSDIVGKWPEAP